MMALILAFGVVSIDPSAGTTGFDFLRIPPGAREAAMGGAATAVAGSPMSFWYNPGHATAAGQARAQVSYLNHIAGIHVGALAYSQGLSSRQGIGAAVVYLNSGTMKRTNENAEEFGTFGVSYADLNVSTALKVIPELDLGVGLHGLYGSIDSFFSLGISACFGATCQLPFNGLSAGLAVQHLGYQAKPFHENRDPMPLDFGLGLGFEPNPALTLALDLHKPIDNRINVRAGIEGRVGDVLTIRGGYSSLGLDWQSGGGSDILAGLTTGLGFRWHGYMLDYCFIPMVELGMAHRLSFTFSL
ncbi:PorV/PorQ family protein [candidate division WOR-3 bacterium]|nr:PorV/PorQ family protein [candidate division WOR-3 bacterium]